MEEDSPTHLSSSPSLISQSLVAVGLLVTVQSAGAVVRAIALHHTLGLALVSGLHASWSLTLILTQDAYKSQTLLQRMELRYQEVKSVAHRGWS